MVDVVRRRGRARAAERQQPLGAAAERYAAMGWPVCLGAYPHRGELGRACSCDRVGCPAPGAHPLSPAWQNLASTDPDLIARWWASSPESGVILATGQVFDVLDVSAHVGITALAEMERSGRRPGPVALGTGNRTHFYVRSR